MKHAYCVTRNDFRSHEMFFQLITFKRGQMFQHILEIEREIYWIYGDVTCAAYPLEYIDTISPTGHINRKSALALIIYGVNCSFIFNKALKIPTQSLFNCDLNTIVHSTE